MKNAIVILFLSSMSFGCTSPKQADPSISDTNKLKIENDSLRALITKTKSNKKNQISTFLTFQKNNAEEAMNFYVSLFDNSEVINIQRWGKEGQGKEGSVMHGIFSLNGKQYMCSDSPAIHEWGFTPAVSNFVDCDNESTLEHLFSKLSEEGQVMMPLNNYGFSQKFGFVEDRFGISWQLNLQ